MTEAGSQMRFLTSHRGGEAEPLTNLLAQHGI
jgi:hypothetical protein